MQKCPLLKLVLSGLFLLTWSLGSCMGVIIPPRWANHTLNPCAHKSWQLLHWPGDEQCYNIFTQGPCEETQELYFNEDSGKASCRCSRGTLWHNESNQCHQEYSKGPCKYKEYFGQTKKLVVENDRLEGDCFKYNECSPGHLFWPKIGKCFPHLSRGPCLQGYLLHIDPNTGSTECGCDAVRMSTNYWPHGDTCHELFTRGPCIQGHIFLYNFTTQISECICGPHLKTNYHEETDRCFELDKPGPCHLGQIFSYDPKSDKAKCKCLKDYVQWPKTNKCYRAYTRGPCSKDQYIQPIGEHGEGQCVNSFCEHGELYDPVSDKCYPVGRKGPCAKGKLWVFERASSVQGSCHCDPHLIGYWEPHGICYELGEQGPCPKRRVLTYERQSGKLKCRCDIRRGFVPWANGRCIKSGVRRTKLIPVAGHQKILEGGNNIITTRVHRGLTLPKVGQANGSHPIKRKTTKIPLIVQDQIFKDIIHNIRNVSFSQSSTSTSVRTEVSKHISPSISVSISRHNQKKEKPVGRRFPKRTEATAPPPPVDNSKENQVNLIDFNDRNFGESQSAFDHQHGNDRKILLEKLTRPRRRRKRLRSRRGRVVHLTRRRLDTREPVVQVPVSRKLRKRMMDRKDIPELVLRRGRRVNGFAENNR